MEVKEKMLLRIEPLESGQCSLLCYHPWEENYRGNCNEPCD